MIYIIFVSITLLFGSPEIITFKNRSAEAVAPSLTGLQRNHIARADFVIMKPKIIGIYKITSPKGKIYIGQSRDCEERERYYSTCRNRDQQRVCNSILKYGWTAHKFEVIRLCSIEQLNELEVMYIHKYDTYKTPHGLNLQRGGYDYVISEDSKRKMRDSHVGKKNPRSNPMSLETRKKISESLKNHPDRSAMNKQISQIQIGRILSEEHKAKLRNKLAIRFKDQRESDRLRKEKNVHSDNKSGYLGVSFYSKMKRYRVTIVVNKKQISGGYFSDPIEAAKKYNELAISNNLIHKKLNRV